MPRQADPRTTEAILRLIGKHPEGIAIAAIAAGLRKPLGRRTLTRRLAELVEQGRIRRQGERRATVYLPPTDTAGARLVPPGESTGKASSEPQIPLSPAGREIREYVRQSITRRTPVGYQREFLDAYVPNRTAYLPDSIREHLHRIGKSPGDDRPAGTYARQILDRLLIDLSWSSSRLEGNTYSQLDTERLIRHGQAAEGKDAQETLMILNHKAAIEFLVAQAEVIGFNRHTFLNLHALLSEGLLRDPDASGRLRRIPVEVTGTVFHPLAIPQVLDECFQQILDTAAAVADPFEQAFFVMVHIPYLQPFEDVNKRVSRLGANIPLIRRNLCPLSFIDVPQGAYTEGTLGVYELRRVELLRDVFVWACERSVQRYVAIRQAMPQPDAFRLRYREALFDLVASVVRERTRDVPQAVSAYAAKWVPVEDRQKFIAMGADEIARLHEGVIARYRLRPSEFEAWKQATPASE